MRTLMFVGLLMLTLLTSPGAIAAEGGWAVVGKAGTMGIGAEVHRVVVPRVLNFRVGAGFFRYSTDFSDNNINYGAKLKLGAVPIGLDVFPFKNWFRLGGGMVINLNEVSGSAKPTQGQITINGRSYSPDQLGQMNGVVKFNRTAPYFGLGFGRTFKTRKHWGVTFDLGAMYHGHAKLSLSTTQTPSAQLQGDLRQQEQRFNDDAKDFTFFPIIQFAVSYRFGQTR